MGKKNGRSNGKERYFAIPHYIMESLGWKFLSVTARAAWLEFGRVHNGMNNGRIAVSSRVLGQRLGICKTAAAEAIKDLITYGFLEIARSSSFSGKRRAAEYRLTHIKDDITGELPSRTFQNIGKISAPKTGNGFADEPSSHSLPVSAQTDNIGRLGGQGLSAQTDKRPVSCPSRRTVS